MRPGICKLPLAGACISALLLTGACHNARVPAGGGGDSLQTFLHQQVDKLSATPLTLYTTHNGRTDSTNITGDSVKAMTAAFRSDLSNLSDASLYKESSFPDSSNHRTVISYQALSDSAALNMADIYIDPDTRVIRKAYLQYVVSGGDSSIRRQLIWEADKKFTLITTVDKNEYTADMLQQKVTWSKP